MDYPAAAKECEYYTLLATVQVNNTAYTSKAIKTHLGNIIREPQTVLPAATVFCSLGKLLWQPGLASENLD